MAEYSIRLKKSRSATWDKTVEANSAEQAAKLFVESNDSILASDEIQVLKNSLFGGGQKESFVALELCKKDNWPEEEYDRNSEISSIIMTTESVSPQPVAEYLGILSEETLVSRGFFGDVSSLKETRQKLLKNLEKTAIARGADAVVAIDFEYCEVHHYILIGVNGTAVRFADKAEEKLPEEKHFESL